MNGPQVVTGSFFVTLLYIELESKGAQVLCISIFVLVTHDVRSLLSTTCHNDNSIFNNILYA